MAQQQLNAGKQNNVIRLIEKIGEAISDKEMHPIKKVAFLQELASIFIQPENQKFGVQILEEAYEAIADIALPAGKRNALKKLAESFSQFHAWNWVVKIINEILQNERPGLEHKVRAVSEIFQSIMKHADAQALLQIIPKCIKCPANDLAIVEISLNLQRDLKKDEDAVKAASLIHQDRLRAKILEEIMQKTDKMRLTDS